MPLERTTSTVASGSGMSSMWPVSHATFSPSPQDEPVPSATARALAA
ncbi:MAG TPA: hypothetical protein VNT55_00530 [Baekduia sp.]|nr:hypothetical protein [Baekduia sp.]